MQAGFCSNCPIQFTFMSIKEIHCRNSDRDSSIIHWFRIIMSLLKKEENYLTSELFASLNTSPCDWHDDRLKLHRKWPFRSWFSHLLSLPSWPLPPCWAGPHPLAHSLQTLDKQMRRQHRKCPTWSGWSSSRSNAAALRPRLDPDSQPGSCCRTAQTTMFQTGKAHTTDGEQTQRIKY